MRPLVILRPEPGASATARAAERAGLRTIVTPLFHIEPLVWDTPEVTDYDALLLTSANAVRFAGPQLQHLARLPAYCVGDATAAAAREAGLSLAGTGTNGVNALLETLPPSQRLLHLCGAHRRQPADSRNSIDAIPVYESVAVSMPEQLYEVEGGVIAVHSARAGARVRELANSGGIDPSAFAIAAISSEAAKAAGTGWQSVHAAEAPTDAALLAIASRLCNNPA